MKTKLFALCTAAVLLLTACTDGAAAAETLKNRQKQVIMYITQTNYDENGEESGWFRTEHRYDEKGNLLGMDNYDGYGSRWEYTYNSEDVKMSQVFYDQDGQVSSTRTFDPNGNPLRSEGTSMVFFADGTTQEVTVITEYTYDELGRSLELVTTENGEESLHQTWTYDDSTHTGTRKTVETTLWGHLKGYVSSWTDELTFNEDWQVLTSHRLGEGDNSSLDEVYTYDEAGNELTHRTSGRNDSEEVSTFDENGNLLQSTYTRNGKLEYKLESTLGTLKQALERQEMLQAQEGQEAAS